MNIRPYQQWYDGSTARTLGTVADNPANNEFLLVGAQNRRIILGGTQGYAVGDLSVNVRGSKNIVWSSEGYTWNGVPITAVTTANKLVSGNSTTLTTSSVLPTGINAITLPTRLDTSAYRALVLSVNLQTITGTSFQPELDMVDDAGNSIAYWKPTALTAAGGYLVTIGLGATGTPPAAPTGWTFTNIAMYPGPQVKFAWTNVATTVCTWTAYIYGIN